MNQENHSKANEIAWSTPKYYDVWCKFYGTPEDVAKGILADPAAKLRRYQRHLGQVQGKRIANLLGSIGRKAVPLALLGANVTVFDISPVNERFAKELAKNAGVELQYEVCDIMAGDLSNHLGTFDIVFLEGGILHYFLDLNALAKRCLVLLRDGGRLILGDFHPFLKCSETQDKGLWTPNGYFDDSIQEGSLPLVRFLPQEEQNEFPKGQYRRWRLGEIITSFAETGFVVRELEETPHAENGKIPGMFHLVADRP